MVHRYFWKPQTRRDQELDHWWQLPDDSTRVRSRWLQTFRDLTSPATFSEWHRRIAVLRVLDYDGVRPPLYHATLLAILVAALWVLDVRGWFWLLLIAAPIQIAIEVHLHRIVSTDEDPGWELGRWMGDTARDNLHTKVLNAGGVTATVACPANIVAACFAPPGGDLGWVKVVALAAAVLYLNSALRNGLLDPPQFTEASRMPPVVHALRPYAPLLSCAAVLAAVATSVYAQLWEPAYVPVAFLCALLVLQVGGTLREYDRTVAVAAQIGRQAVLAGREELGRVVHDDLNAAKFAAASVHRLAGVAAADKFDLMALPIYLTHFGSRVGMTPGLRMELSDLAVQLASPYGVAPEDITCEISWESETLRIEDHRVSIRMATALVHNVCQAVNRLEHAELPKSFELQAYTTGSDHQLRYHLAVIDHLPVIPPTVWCQEGDSMTALREWLQEDFDGDLEQEQLADGRKRIIAWWHDRYQGEDD